MTNAIKFIKDHGVEKAREVVEGAPCNAIYYWQIPRCKHGVYSTYEQNQGRAIVLAQLRGLVDSIGRVESLGGIERTKYLLDVMKKMSPKETSTVKFVKQAIADYESIGGEHV